MARRVVVEVQCSRCDRKELREETQTLQVAVMPPPALKIWFADKEVVFEDLCTPCQGAVAGHIESIGKKISGLSPERKKNT
jgi:hypothetical protein